MWWLIVIAIILILFVILYLIGLKLFYFDLFNKRASDYQPVYEEIIKNHPDFKCVRSDYINNKGVRIAGCFYFYEKSHYKGLIINAPGLYNCKETQLSRLEMFAQEGYLIYSYDPTGVGDSEGDNIVGLGHSVVDLRNTINYLSSLDELKDMNWALYGHSWGGYAVSSVANYPLDHKIKVIIEKAGFNSVYDEFYFQGYQKIKWLTKLFMPAIMFLEHKRIPENKDLLGKDGIKNSHAHVLVMHSEDDHMVGYHSVIDKYEETFEHDKMVKFQLFTNHGHIIDQEVKSLEHYYQLSDEGKLDGNSHRYARLLVKDVDHHLVHQEISFMNHYMLDD